MDVNISEDIEMIRLNYAEVTGFTVTLIRMLLNADFYKLFVQQAKVEQLNELSETYAEQMKSLYKIHYNNRFPLLYLIGFHLIRKSVPKMRP